jgi:hypothetical protein
MKIAHKEGYIGGRVPKRLQNEFTKWTDDHMKSKTDIIEFCIQKFLAETSCQDEFLKRCQNGKHC